MIREIAIGRELILDILRGLNEGRQVRVEGIPDEAKCIGAVYDSPRKALLIRVDVDVDASADQEIDVTIVEKPFEETPNTMFIAGKVVGDPEDKKWEFMGLFTSEADAVASCTTDKMFVGPTAVGERWPDETIEWPGAYYPMLETPPIADEVPSVSSTTESE